MRRFEINRSVAGLVIFQESDMSNAESRYAGPARAAAEDPPHVVDIGGNSRAERRSLVLMSVVGLGQGILGPLVKILAFPPLPLAFGRCVVAAACLWVIGAYTGRRIVRDDRLTAVLCGVLLAGHFGTLFLAYSKADANIVIVALFTYPMMTSLLEPLFFSSKRSGRQLFSATLIVAGVACLSLTAVRSGQPFAGIGLALLSALLFSLRNILSRKLVMRSDGVAIMAWQTTVAAFVFAPTCLWLPASALTMNACLGILAVGALFTAVPHTLRVLVKQHLTTTTVDILASLQVFGGVALSSLILKEPITPSLLLGAAFVLAGALGEGASVWIRGARA